MTGAESDRRTQQDDCVDEVEESWRVRKMGVKVERVVRNGYEEDQKLLKVYQKRTDKYNAIDGSGTKTAARWVKIGELPVNVSTEVLFGLAEAHGYDLEAR